MSSYVTSSSSSTKEVKMPTIGYKATHNYKCRNKEYKVGKTYKMSKQPSVCERGFHYCLSAKSVLTYYPYTSDFKLLEIQDLSSRTDHEADKSATDKIKFIREITDPEELYNLLGVYKKFDDKGYEIYVKEAGYHNINYVEKHLSPTKGNISVKRTVDKNESWVEITYNSNGQPTKVQKSCGYIQTTKYDKKGRLIEEKCTDGTFTYVEYDADGLISNRKANSGQQIKTTVSKDGVKTRIVKSDDGNVMQKTITNSKGLETFDKAIRCDDSVSIDVTTYHPNNAVNRIVSKALDSRGKLTDLVDQTFSKNGNLLKEKTLYAVTENFYKKDRLVKTVETTIYK